MYKIKSSQSNFYGDKVNSKSATRLFYRPFSFLFVEISELNYLYFTAVNAISKTNFVFKIHFKTFTKIPHSQWFVDILGTSICPLKTTDQLERMTLGMWALATRNKQYHFSIRYNMSKQRL